MKMDNAMILATMGVCLGFAGGWIVQVATNKSCLKYKAEHMPKYTEAICTQTRPKTMIGKGWEIALEQDYYAIRNKAFQGKVDVERMPLTCRLYDDDDTTKLTRVYEYQLQQLWWRQK